eukprot:2795222-Amphidinium_carterae.1
MSSDSCRAGELKISVQVGLKEVCSSLWTALLHHRPPNAEKQHEGTALWVAAHLGSRRQRRTHTGGARSLSPSSATGQCCPL